MQPDRAGGSHPTGLTGLLPDAARLDTAQCKWCREANLR